ncbi:protein prune homolog 2 [Pieris rapae]|uniref:protein prune homolog 2 n=1 Tax=Pieris rapae TaxID=64459 RepID=UPI001E2803B8|nr:protein prune homolog 2 [Pieris rapae]
MSNLTEDSAKKMDTASSIHSTSNSNYSEYEDATMNSLTTEVLETAINKNKCTLTLTTYHPLMGLASPEEKKDEKHDDSLSSIETDKTDDSLYSPQKNSSDSLYMSADLNMCNSLLNGLKRSKIKPNMSLKTPDNVIYNFESRIVKRSTPKVEEERFSEARVWCDSLSNVQPNFDLPMEMSSGINHVQNDHNSEIWSNDKSYVALMDVYSGSVALRSAVFKPQPKRKIRIPAVDDTCSIESDCSIESEPAKDIVYPPSEDEGQRSKSTATASECSDQIPEYSASEEYRDERSWLHVQHSGVNANCDMKVIEPFKRVISHGGYSADGAAIIVFSACFLPDNARPDYRYVMDNLFLYVIWSLERLVTDEYILVYLHGSAGKRRMPTYAWLHECYKLIDIRLRKNLKHLYLVHPTFWLKSFVVITKLFVSSKFFHKLNYVKSLDELFSKVPVEPNAIPERVKQFDIHCR